MVLGVLTGWLERREREAIDYLVEENRLLRYQLGRRRLRLTDTDRRRWRSVPSLDRTFSPRRVAPSRGARVVVEESTESRASPNPTVRVRRGSASNQDVAQPLVIALDVVMRDVLREGPAEEAFAQRDDPVEALGLDRAYKSLGVRVRIRRADRRLYHGNAGLDEAFANLATPLLIPIADKDAMRGKETLRGRQRSDDLLHEQLIRPLCRTDNHDPPGGQLDHEHGVDTMQRVHVTAQY